MRQSIEFRGVPLRRFGVELEVSKEISKAELAEAAEEFERLRKEQGLNRRDVFATLGPTGWAQSKLNAYWHVKYDSSCGWEVASFVGSGSDDVTHIAEMGDFLGGFGGAKTTDRCGLHVHVETKDFNSRTMGILLARWLKVERWLMRICHPSRTRNIFCKSLWERVQDLKDYLGYNDLLPSSPELLWAKMMPRDLSVHDNLEKRYSLNTVGFATGQANPLYNRNTVELRLPECFLGYPHIANWTKLFLNFVEQSRIATAPANLERVQSVTEFLTYLGLWEDDALIVLDEELLQTKIWLLNKILGPANYLFDKAVVNQASEVLEFITKI